MRREPSMPQRRRRFEHRAVQSQVAVEVPRAGQPRRGDSRASAGMDQSSSLSSSAAQR